MYKYQIQAVEKICKEKRLGLFLGMGLGKTLIALQAVKKLGCKTLVIAPKKIAETTWTDENEKWNIGLKIVKVLGEPIDRIYALREEADVYIINRDNVSWLFARKILPKWEMLIIDESTSFKSPRTQRFRALKKKLKLFDRILIMTGTPIANNIADLWSQIFILDNGERLGKYVSHYREEYLIPMRTQYGFPIYRRARRGAKEIVCNKIKDITITMRSEDYLELPAVAIENIILKNNFKNEYAEMQTEFLTCGITAKNAAACLNKLQQLANGFLYETDLYSDEKINAVKDLMETGDPLLIYYKYEEDKRRLLELPGAKEITPTSINEWNNGECSLLIAHPLSSGYGLNLQQGGHIVVWYGLPWSYEQYSQGNARLHRMGQEKQVLIKHLITKDTVDEIILDRLKQKKNVSDYVLDVLKEALQK